MIPFKTQFDKLTTAYIEGKVDPYRECACFVGNLLNGTSKWDGIRWYKPNGCSTLLDPTPHAYEKLVNPALESIKEQSDGMYSPEEILHLENVFLYTLEQGTTGACEFPYYRAVLTHPNYEEALFKAFCITLDELKKIHESKGEVVDEFIFTKRQKKEVA